MWIHSFFLFDAKEGKCLLHAEWDSHQLKPPSTQATWSHPGKAKSYEPKALNETMLPMRRKNSLTISHIQHSRPQIPIPISTKEKEWGS